MFRTFAAAAFRYAAALAMLFGSQAWAQAGSMAAAGSSLDQRLSYDVKVLADDLLEGRETGQRGHDFAAQFVAERFRSLELEPIDDELGYLQLVPMQLFRQKYRGGMRFFIEGQSFEPITELVGRTQAPDVRLAHAPIVFVGWGFVSDAYGRDDYEGLDVNGAIVIALRGAPSFLPADERAHFTQLQVKVAAELGAAAFISIVAADDEKGGQTFERLADDYVSMQMLRWVDPEGSLQSETPGLLAQGLMSEAGARRLFDLAEKPWANVNTEAGTKKSLVVGYPLGIVGSLQLGAQSSNVSSPNVIGVVPGTSEELSKQAIVITAHLDHRGRRTIDGIDVIHNGAINNATGVATLLELAKHFEANPPARTLVFAAVTGHEQGLVGSDYLIKHGMPQDLDPVLNINLDAPLVSYPFTDMVALGGERTSLLPIIEEALAEHDVALADDLRPLERAFSASDHYSFARRGIPMVHLAMGEGGNGRDAFRTYVLAHSHQSTDDPDLILFDQLARYTDIHRDLITEIANSERPPRWNRMDKLAQILANQPD